MFVSIYNFFVLGFF